MNQENTDSGPEKKTPRKKTYKPIVPCLEPGKYYFVDDLIEGGLAGKNKFTEWYRKGLKPLDLDSKRPVVSADAIIALGLMGDNP